jgi:hypothetical protein
MQFMRAVLAALFTLCLLGLVATFAIESSYTARAVRVQFVRIDATQHNPFGPVTKEVGQPIFIIAGSEKAFLKNRTALGLPTVDADNFEQHPELGIQLEPLQSSISIARVGCLIAAFLTGIGWGVLPRFKSLFAPPET